MGSGDMEDASLVVKKGTGKEMIWGGGRIQSLGEAIQGPGFVTAQPQSSYHSLAHLIMTQQ